MCKKHCGDKARTFHLHWIGNPIPEKVVGNGSTEEEALKDALRRAGYGGGALSALDYYKEVK